jgi:hypothetical protein
VVVRGNVGWVRLKFFEKLAEQMNDEHTLQVLPRTAAVEVLDTWRYKAGLEMSLLVGLAAVGIRLRVT